MPTLASIDIGSNTAHLLVAQPMGQGLVRVRNESEWLGLGEAVERNGFIPDALVARLVETMTRFAQSSLADGARDVFVFGTEAIRSAANRDEVLKLVKRKAKLDVKVITGKREAELGFRGASLDTDVTAEPAAFVEVGGGSVQIARVCRNVVLSDVSLPLGTGRLAARLALTSPASSEAVTTLREVVRSEIHSVHGSESVTQVLASGGVARGIWKALHPDGEKRVERKELEFLIWASARLPVEVVARRFNVKLKRAGTLLSGASVYLEALDLFGCERLWVSEFGVREGAILELNEGKVKSCRV